jgi:flagellar motor switch protein FliG
MALSGLDKAAILLSCIGEELAAKILKNLDIDEISKISNHMTKCKVINKEDMMVVFQELTGFINGDDLTVAGEQYIKNVLYKGLGEDTANKILGSVSIGNTLESLKGVDSKTLLNFLVTEHPQTIALILSLLEPSQAGEILMMLPDSIKFDVALRIASIEKISESAIEEIEDVLRNHLQGNKGKERNIGGVKTIAEILNRTNKNTEQLLLGKIEEHNSALADSIRQLMFTFDDLVTLDDRGIQAILKEVSTDELALALKTASEELKAKIFKNMSQRAAEILKEEMETKGPVRVSEVLKAQQNIVNVARRLEDEGKIVIASKGGEELVV